jgi:hypothetical protein
MMSRMGTAFRWILAPPVFVLCWAIGLTLGATPIRALGASTPYSNMGGIGFATICGGLAGILTAPLRHRRFATHLFVIGNIAYLFYAIVRRHWEGDLGIREFLA